MRDRDYYPAGAYDDPNAPYNEVSVPDKSFDVFVSQTLSKSTEVTTDDYIPRFDEEDCPYADTDSTNFKDAYTKEHMTPLQLIEKFKEFLTKHLPDPIVDISGFKESKRLIKECEGWVEDELTVLEE